MARKQSESIKPLFPMVHDFRESLDRYTHEAGMLADAVRTVVRMDEGINPNAKRILEERLAAFHEARFGDETD